MCVFMITVTLNPGIVLDKIEAYTTKIAKDKKE
jgi:hypothetical protein